MSLAEHVRMLGRGPGRARSLTRDEAFEAMTEMLSGQAAPEAVGAILMLMRMKGEIADEIAGFAEAAQAALPVGLKADLDWPSYAAGRTRGAPWFLLSARLVADQGRRVLVHGWNGADPKVRAGLADAGIPVARDPAEAAELLETGRIAYLPLEAMHPALFKLLTLREKLGLRSCVNTVCRMLNPGRAGASVQGVFHPSYRLLQADAAARMGWDALTVIKGGGGEFERLPTKAVAGFGLRAGALWEGSLPARVDEARRLADSAATLPELWTGAQTREFELQTVLGTAALAFETLGEADPDALAHALWANRAARRAA